MAGTATPWRQAGTYRQVRRGLLVVGQRHDSIGHYLIEGWFSEGGQGHPGRRRVRARTYGSLRASADGEPTRNAGIRRDCEAHGLVLVLERRRLQSDPPGLLVIMS